MPIKIKTGEPTKFMQSIRKRRKELGISVSRFAELCKIKIIDYSECEHGQQSPTAYEQLTMLEVLNNEFEKMMKHNKKVELE